MSKKLKPSAAILSGTPAIINKWLQLDKGAYKTQTSCNALSKKLPPDLNGIALMEELYQQIEKNWKDRSYTKTPSGKNWRWEKQLTIRKSNTSPEKRLEKHIAKITADDWVNQIPVASGLTGAHAMKKACVDLGHKLRDKHFELIELKWGSDHPIFAAMEIILYGLLYIFARVKLVKLYPKIENALLRGPVFINMQVLAPDSFYLHKKFGAYQLKELERILSNGIAQFAVARVKNPNELTVPYLKMDFKFTVFPNDFTWPCRGDQVQQDAQLKRAMLGIKPVYK